MSRSPLGLNNVHDRIKIRNNVCKAAILGAKNRSHMIYTEGPARWSGIAQNKIAARGEFPPAADCSAYVTWCFWTYTRHFRYIGDFVNGLNWTAGYTGTMTQHGQDIKYSDLIHADVVFYGGSWAIPAHTALYIGNGQVVSHGQQGDPRVYPVNLYGALPITRYKRYIR